MADLTVVTKQDFADLEKSLTEAIMGVSETSVGTKQIVSELSQTVSGLSQTASELSKTVAELAVNFHAALTETHTSILGHMDEHFAAKEDLHDSETRLLRGFEHYARSNEAHLIALDGHATVNFLAGASLAERMASLEARMLELETRRNPS